MDRKRLRAKPWYNNAVAVCIGVILYVVLTRFSDVREGIGTFAGYFAPVLTGALIAYIVNPLARFYSGKLFKKLKRPERRASLGSTLAIVTVVLLVVALLLVILPQLVESIQTFANNLDGYIASVEQFMERYGILERFGLNSDTLRESYDSILKTAGNYIVNNLSSIMNYSATAGRSVFQFVLGFILSIYILAEKSKLRTGTARLMRASFTPAHYRGVVEFLRRCDSILQRYIVFNLLDSLLVGVANGIFMGVTGMPYAGLVSFVVAVTNLIPTFGPFIGAVVGAFVLVLVRPFYALAFLGFTVVLQICDGYILKPRLFGNSLGVSGLWILVGVVVGGRMFGAVGMLAAIPAVAILDYIYRDLLLPWLERRRGQMQKP